MEHIYEIPGEEWMIKTEIPFLSLLELEIIHKANAHGTVEMKILLARKDEEEFLYTDWSGTKLQIWKKGKEESLLFIGIMEELIFHRERGTWMGEIKGMGGTVSLDREKKKRSFQKKEATYGQVIREILKEYGKASFRWEKGEDKVIGKPYIQYKETDWEFLNRLCSNENQSLIPDIRREKPQFSIGMEQGMERETREMEIMEKGFDSIYYENGFYESPLKRENAFYMKVKTKENWEIGDYIFHGGRKYFLYKKRGRFQKGEMLFDYYLGTKKGLFRKKQYNPSLAGLSLEGTIKGIKEERIYIHLDMDEEERADYPWIWAPETNNVCYCMPEKETKAALYFPTKEEGDAIGVLAVVKNKDIYKSNEERELRTESRKTIGLYPEKLFLEGRDGKVNISLEDKKGVFFQSQGSIFMEAEGKLLIKGESIHMDALVEVVAKTKEANIEICRDFNFYAPKGIRTIGEGKEEEKERILDREEGEEGIEHWQLAYGAMGGVPVLDPMETKGEEGMAVLLAMGSVPQTAKGSAVVALSQAMEGKREKDCTFPNAFRSMEIYTVRGGRPLPEE